MIAWLHACYACCNSIVIIIFYKMTRVMTLYSHIIDKDDFASNWIGIVSAACWHGRATYAPPSARPPSSMLRGDRRRLIQQTFVYTQIKLSHDHGLAAPQNYLVLWGVQNLQKFISWILFDQVVAFVLQLKSSNYPNTAPWPIVGFIIAPISFTGLCTRSTSLGSSTGLVR